MLGLDLSGPQRLVLPAIHRRSGVPEPALLAAIGLMMRQLGVPNPAQGLFLLARPTIGEKISAWRDALELVGLEPGVLLSAVRRALHVPPPTEVAAVTARPTAQRRPQRSGNQRIQIADPSAVQHAINGLPSDRGQWPELLKTFLRRDCEISLRRVHDRDLAACQKLCLDFPNFSEALAAITQRLRLQRHCRAPAALPPLLLVGPPGCGKTEFVRAVARTLAGDFLQIALERTTAGFALTGSHASWHSAAPGEIAQLLLRRQVEGPPIVLLDEIDKCPTGNYPVQPALLGLLDRSSARQFRDEFLRCELDTTVVSYLATANSLEGISEPLLSRLQPIEVPLPSPAQMPAIARSVDQALRRENPWLARGFAPTPEAVYRGSSNLAPRVLRRAFERAYAVAAERHQRQLYKAGRPALAPADLIEACRDASAGAPARRPIGFLPEPVHD